MHLLRSRVGLAIESGYADAVWLCRSAASGRSGGSLLNPLLWLVSLYALFGLTNKGLWAYLSIALLGIGFALSPVAHVAFYYVGIISKKAYKRSGEQVCSDEDSELINEAVLFLDITWRTAIA